MDRLIRQLIILRYTFTSDFTFTVCVWMRITRILSTTNRATCARWSTEPEREMGRWTAFPEEPDASSVGVLEVSPVGVPPVVVPEAVTATVDAAVMVVAVVVGTEKASLKDE